LGRREYLYHDAAEEHLAAVTRSFVMGHNREMKRDELSSERGGERKKRRKKERKKNLLDITLCFKVEGRYYLMWPVLFVFAA
jgi:hypothetical protein